MKYALLALTITMPLNWAVGSLTPADNEARLRQIDRNHNSTLEKDEVELGLYYRATQGKLDLKSPPSIADVQRRTKEDMVFRLLRHEFITDHGDKPSYRFDEVHADTDFRLPKPTAVPQDLPLVPLGRFLLRRSLDKIPATLADTDEAGAEMAKSADKLASNGALFSYGRHFPSSTDQWTAEGVFAYEKAFVGGFFGDTSIGRNLYSIGFSRVDFGGDVKRDVGEFKPAKLSKRFQSAEANSLVFGFSNESLVNWPQGVLGFTGSILRINALWKTDWDFESQIPTGELEWSFLNGRLGMGSFNTKSDYLWWRLEAAVHVDAGYVATDGEWTKSVQGTTFAHVGPKLSLCLIPFPLAKLFENNPLVFTATFGQYERLTDESKEVRLATADASWYLRKPGTGKIGPIDPGVALTLSFKHYQNVENEQDDNSLILGFAVGF